MELKRYVGVKLLSKSNTDKIIEDVEASNLKSIVYKVGSQLLIDRKFPLHLYIELSRKCNYHCPMCMRDKAAPGGHFPIHLAEKIVTEAAEYGPTSYSLHLFGEPLSNPKWHDIVKLIKDAHPHNGVLLTTNGYFLNETVSQKLIDLKVDRIFVSLHSMNSEIYKKNTGGGELSTVLKNIINFKKIADTQSKTKLYVRLFAGKHEPKTNELELKLFDELQIPIEVRGYHNFAGGKSNWTAFHSKVERWPCYHLWFTLGIGVDGRATICCADYKFDLEVGNIKNNSISELWQSSLIQLMRNEHRKNKYKFCDICRQCDTWQFHPNIFFNLQKIK